MSYSKKVRVEEPRVRAYVLVGLARGWSPEQVSEGMRREFPGEEGMRAGREAIHRAPCVQGRGSLRQEPKAGRPLRSGRRSRRPRSAPPPRGAGRGDGGPRRPHRGHGRQGVPLRPALPLAEGHQRERRRAAAPALPEGDRLHEGRRRGRPSAGGPRRRPTRSCCRGRRRSKVRSPLERAVVTCIHQWRYYGGARPMQAKRLHYNSGAPYRVALNRSFWLR